MAGGSPAGRKEVGSMQYFGVPTCPYCKKRVNLIRTWSLKRQGEYQCPRCGGISNIYLSPLIYVVALLALFAGGAVYFFHKFVLNDITLDTALQVFIPFALFFLFSVFFVYLAKPVIKKVSREELEKKKRGRSKEPASSTGALPQTGREYYDGADYPPQQVQPAPPPVRPAPRPESRQRPAPVPEAQQPLSRRLEGTAPQSPARPQTAPPRPQATAAPAYPQPGYSQQAARRQAPAPRQQAAAAIRPPVPVSRPPRQAQPVSRPVQSSVQEPPRAADDFFAKYDDPAYVQRRLQEIKRKDG